MDFVLYILLFAVILTGVLALVAVLRCGALEREIRELRKELRDTVQQSFSAFGEMISTNQKDMACLLYTSSYWERIL